MAVIGRSHHKNLLKASIHPNEEEREQKIQEVLEAVKDKGKLLDSTKNNLDTLIDKEGVRIALKETANSTAPGLDSIIYEYWKFLQRANEEDMKRSKPKYPGLNIMTSLTKT